MSEGPFLIIEATYLGTYRGDAAEAKRIAALYHTVGERMGLEAWLEQAQPGDWWAHDHADLSIVRLADKQPTATSGIVEAPTTEAELRAHIRRLSEHVSIEREANRILNQAVLDAIGDLNRADPNDTPSPYTVAEVVAQLRTAMRQARGESISQPVIRVQNIRTTRLGEYVGRMNAHADLHGSPLANPWPLLREADREPLIQRYATWLLARLQHDGKERREFLRLAEAAKAGTLVLLCWCHPKPCHADSIAALLLRFLAGEALWK
jgi:hypothetical protein